MSALWDYVAELERQAELLSDGSAWDDLTLASTRPNSGGRRQHWKQQDGNRAEYEYALDEIAARNLAFTDLQAALADLPHQRRRTRLERLLYRHRRSIGLFHAAALAEAEQRGLFNGLAPLIANALQAHRLLIAAYAGDDALDWREVEASHQTAARELRDHLPQDIPLTPSEARSKFCFEEWQRGKTYKEINSALKRHLVWEHFEDERSVRGPIEAWGRRIGVKPRKRPPGRRSKAARDRAL